MGDDVRAAWNGRWGGFMILELPCLTASVMWSKGWEFKARLMIKKLD
jgi:hypothetical protein